MGSDHFTTNYAAFRKDLVEYVLTKNFLQEVGQVGPWKSALEVGGKEGTVARLLKGEGKTSHVDCIDIVPCYKQLTTGHFKKLMRDIYQPKYAGVRIPRRLAGLVNPKYYDWTGTQSREFAYLPDKNFGWNVSIKQSPEPNNFIIGDFIEHPLTQTYDLISALLCIEYFDPEKLFARVSSLLNPGGTFVFLVNYWWFPVNSIEHAGDFPYACQRLTKDDFRKYLEECEPNNTNAIMERYDYFHKGNPQTLTSYEKLAKKNGLSLLGEKRCMPSDHTSPRTPLMPSTLDKYPETQLDDVLKDIHQFRTDVSVADLKTAFVMMAFQKPKEVKGCLKVEIDDLKEHGYGLYKRPQ